MGPWAQGPLLWGGGHRDVQSDAQTLANEGEATLVGRSVDCWGEDCSQACGGIVRRVGMQGSAHPRPGLTERELL